MTRTLFRFAFCALLAVPALAQTTLSAPDLAATHSATPRPAYLPPVQGSGMPSRFSRFAFGGGVSSMGINLQGAVMAARHLNVRATGNFFNYEDSSISTSGFTVDAKLNFATAGVSLDYFPWANHGLRLSPGLLLHNGNSLNALMVAAGGTSFTLNDVTYYSSPNDPVKGAGSLGLNTAAVAPTITLGWGNMIPRNGGHFSFPVELGAAYTGAPSLKMALTSGQVCADPQGTINCQNVVGNSDVNNNLQAQIAKDQKDLSPLRFYPIVSAGVSYSFGVGRGGAR